MSGFGREAKLYVLSALTLFLLLFFLFATARPGLVDYAPYLSFSPDTDGVKAIRLLMEREGAAVKEWRLPPERLPSGEGQLFVSIEPVGMTAESAARLRDWAAGGNDVVVFGGEYGIVGDLKTIYVDPRTANEGAVTAFPPGEAPRRAEAETAEERRFEPASPELAELIGDEAGALAVRRAIGGGAATAALTAEWLRNDTVLERDHFELSWLLLGGESLSGRTVYFDEYHHGYSVSPGIGQVYPPWLLAALLQAALAGCVWLWRRGKRFGPAYTPRAFRVRRGDETLLAVAGWHKRGRLTFEALDAAVAELRRALQSRAGVPAGAGAAQLAEAAAQALAGRRKPPEALRGVLERWEALRREAEGGGRPKYAEKAWLADSAVLADTMMRLEEER